MDRKSISLTLAILLLSMFVFTGSGLTKSITDRVIADFEEGLKNAKIYQETVASDSEDLLKITLTVYDEPVKIDYLYSSMDEVDFSTPEGMLLSHMSCITREWFNTNYDIPSSLEYPESDAESWFEVEVEKREPFIDYIVARIELTYSETEYVIFKRFRTFPGNIVATIATSMPDALAVEKHALRWKVSIVPSRSALGYILDTFWLVKIPIFTDMLSGRFNTPVFEVQQLYNEAYNDGRLDPFLLSSGLRLFINGNVSFNLADFLSTSYGEEFSEIGLLSSDRKTWDELLEERREAGRLDSEEMKQKVQEASMERERAEQGQASK